MLKLHSKKDDFKTQRSRLKNALICHFDPAYQEAGAMEKPEFDVVKSQDIDIK